MNFTKNAIKYFLGFLFSTYAVFAAESTPVITKAGVQLSVYGFASLTAAYNDSRSNNGNFDNTVSASDLTNEDDGGWYLTPNLTRLGVNIAGSDSTAYIQTSGKIEVDFYGGGSATAPVPRLRHGYGQVTFGKTGFSILAGQTWDVISPLITPILNAGMLTNSGDPGMRRAQLRLTESIPVADGSVDIAAAVVRSVGIDQPYTGVGETGTDGDIPAFEGRIGVALPLWVEGKKVGVGISGHYGREEFDIDGSGATKDVPTWSVNGDLYLPILKTLTLLGEGFYGEDLATYGAGIGRGVVTNAEDPKKTKTIKAYGGWAALQYNPAQKLAFNLGAGVDKIDKESIEDVGGARRNRSAFVNAAYKLTPTFTVGLEYLRIETDYLNTSTGKTQTADLNRGQLSLNYGF